MTAHGRAGETGDLGRLCGLGQSFGMCRSDNITVSSTAIRACRSGCQSLAMREGRCAAAGSIPGTCVGHAQEDSAKERVAMHRGFGKDVVAVGSRGLSVSGSVSREKLTVLIPCKDEVGQIRACVDAIRPIADEILVADSGSTDGTLRIVRQLENCRVIEREYVNSADFKNWAIPQAAHEWVFIVDADERVPAALLAEIEDILRNPPPDKDAYSCGFRDFFLGHELRFAGWDTASIRLIRRDLCRYQKRRVHSNVTIDRSRVGKLKTRIDHYSISSYEDFIEKYNRYTTWASQELWDSGRRATFRTLLVRPLLRFISAYFLRGGFLDGLPGLQVCMLMAFFNTYIKQGKLWEREAAEARLQSSHEPDDRVILPFEVPGDRVSACLPTVRGRSRSSFTTVTRTGEAA